MSEEKNVFGVQNIRGKKYSTYVINLQPNCSASQNIREIEVQTKKKNVPTDLALCELVSNL